MWLKSLAYKDKLLSRIANRPTVQLPTVTFSPLIRLMLNFAETKAAV
jgi:hypothetical protein